MSKRLVISVALAFAVCAQTPGTSAPFGEGSSTLELASMAAATLDPALILARNGEPSAAYDLAADVDDDDARAMSFRARLLAEMGRYADADSVQSLFTPMVDDEDLFLHQLRRAALNHHAERFDAALEALAAIDSIPGTGADGLAAYRDFIAMRAHLARGDVDRAVEVGDAGRERGLPAALETEYDELLVEVYQAADRAEEAIALARSLQQRARGWRTKARHLHTEYEIHARAADLEQARGVALKLVSRYPGYAGTGSIADEIVSNVEPAQMSVEELATYGGFYTRASRFDEAMGMLVEMKKRTLTRHQQERRRLLLAQYYYRAGEYARAAMLSKPAYESPSYKRESTLILARSYRRSNRERDAARLYEYFAKEHPNDVKAAEALFVAAHIYRRLGDDSGYDRVSTRLTKSYPSSYFGRTVALMTAQRHARRGQHEQSAKVLARLVRRSRGTDESALYYLQHAYGEAGDDKNKHLILNQLRDLDSFSFYLHPTIAPEHHRPLVTSTGALSLDGRGGLIEFLERSNRERNAAFERIRAQLEESDDSQAPEGYAAALRRGRWFLEVGLREWGERELEVARRLSHDSPTRMLELGQVYDEFAMPWRSVRVYLGAKGRMPWRSRGELAGDFRWLLYPTPYPVQVISSSARFGVPTHLAYAMMREESRFDYDAVSRAGALGLMQIMPETGRTIARELELPGWTADELLNPEINVTFGVWYASSLLDAAGGDPLWMLAAYNAGPGNARRWFKSEGGPIETVDGIDFKETRLYVQRIVESANVYHSLYFGADAMGSEPPR